MARLDIARDIATRKYKKPSRITHLIYRIIMCKIIARKYNVHYNIIDNPKDCKGPCFIIWNHLSRLDHIFIMQCASPRPVSMLAGYPEFHRSHLHAVFKLQRIIPKKIFAQDLISMRAIKQIIKQGGAISFSPEGMSSIYGTNQPVVAGTGHFLKHYDIPVYFIKMKGAYLTSTKHCNDERYGKIEIECRLLFSQEQLRQTSDEEIERIVNQEFDHDDFKWARENKIAFKHKNDLAKGLSNICYKCPKCGAEMHMVEDGNIIKCGECGNGALINDYFAFEPFEGSTLPDSPVDWVAWEREQVIKEIRENPNFEISAPVKLGYLPNDHYIKNKETAEICGEGIIKFNHQGVDFEGTRFGEKYSFHLTYQEVFTFVIMNETDRWGWFIKGEYHEFRPEKQMLGKLFLVCEEMHRLHVNYWKNLPRYDYMYEPYKNK